MIETVEHQGRVHVVQNGIESTSYAVERATGEWVVMVPMPAPGFRGVSRDHALYVISGGMDTWYTTDEAAARLDAHPATVCRWARAGKFPNAVRVGRGQGGGWRIPESDIKKLQEEK